MSLPPTAPLAANGANPAPRWHARLTAVARAMPYPPTPDLAPVVMRRLAPRPAAAARPRRLAYGLVLALILLAAILAVPSVRAGLLEFIQLGAVRILFAPSATPTGIPSQEPTLVPSVLDLGGQTTLAEARAQVDFAIRLPAYPPDLGEPDLAFVQDLDGQSVVLVWLAPGSESEVLLSLHLLHSPLMAQKLFHDVEKDNPPGLELTEVNDALALWTTGPYVLINRRGGFVERRLVEGHALIWVEGALTYRLETQADLAEAVRIAASLAE